MLSARKFVFSVFDFEACGMNLFSSLGYVSWQYIHKIDDEDEKLQANQRKATKLPCKALYSANNRQEANLALTIFSRKITAC